MITDEQKREIARLAVSEINERHGGALIENRFIDKCCQQSAYGVFEWLEANGFQVVGGTLPIERPAPIQLARPA